MQVHLKLPASIANLGPGFDILAAAVQLQNEVSATPTDDGEMHLEVIGEGAAELHDPSRNRLIQAYASACAELEIPRNRQGVRIDCNNRIPLRRGLGSSAAAALGGILLAASLHKAPWDEAEILRRAAQLEGHRDNAAAALLGGVVICGPEAAVARMDIDERLRAVVLVPDRELATEASRAVIASAFSRDDAVFNASRCALLIRALAERDWSCLGTAMQDRWHQPARAQLLPRLPDVLDAALAAGAYGACLAGAGPSVLAISAGESEEVASRWQESAAALGWLGRMLVLPFRNFGTRVEIFS